MSRTNRKPITDWWERTRPHIKVWRRRSRRRKDKLEADKGTSDSGGK